MASTSGCQLAYSVKSVDSGRMSRSTSFSDSLEASAIKGNRLPPKGFNRSKSIANFQAYRKKASDIVRCDLSVERASSHQSLERFLDRHNLNKQSRVANSFKKISSCPDLQQTLNTAEKDGFQIGKNKVRISNPPNSLLDQDGNVSLIYSSECHSEECMAEGRSCEQQQMPARQINRLFSRSASITQALAGNRRFMTSSISQVARPVFRHSLINGFAGILMAFFLAAAGAITALKGMHNQSFYGSKDCGKCSGMGHEKCHVCGGRGEVVWEGKVFHWDPCPACIGEGVVKCRGCKPRRGLSYNPLNLGLST